MRRTLFPIIMICAICALMLTGCGSAEYSKALTLMENGDFAAAKAILDVNPEYGDSAELLELCRKELSYAEAERFMREDKFEEALAVYNDLGAFRDSKERATICLNFITYLEAVSLYEDGQWIAAGEAFTSLGAYRDAEAHARRCKSEAILAEAEEMLMLAENEDDDDAASLVYSQVIGLLADMPDTAATRERHNLLKNQCVFEQIVIDLNERLGEPGQNRDFAAFS